MKEAHFLETQNTALLKSWLQRLLDTLLHALHAKVKWLHPFAFKPQLQLPVSPQINLEFIFVPETIK